MSLLEKYQKYLVDCTMPGYKPRWYFLSADGWKLLIRENITPLIEQKLQMFQLGDYIWADEYDDGKRRVLSFFKINDAYATLQWGWNFDFVPKGTNAVWARTDKSIYTHIFEVSPAFYDPERDRIQAKHEARKNTVIGRYDIDARNPERALHDKINQHKETFLRLLPLMIEYYRITPTYEDIIKRIDYNMKDAWYRFINSGDLMISKVFIEKRMGLQNQAQQDFEKILFSDEKIKDAYLKKFNRI